MTITSSSVIKKLLILILVFAGLYFAKRFLMPLALGGVLATILLPLSKWMEGKKVPKVLAVSICLIVLILIISGIGALLGWQISELINDFSLISEKIIETGNRIQEFIFSNFGITVKKQTQILKNEQPSIAGIMQKIVGSLSYFITNLILVLAYIFLLLYYRVHIKKFILKLTKTSQQKEMGQVLDNVTKVSQQYLIGLIKMIVCLWIMYGIGFSIIGVKNAIFFAILCGIFEIVPYIGNLTGTTLTLLVAIVNGASPLLLVAIIGVYLMAQLIQGWVLGPIILGPQVRINAFTTIISMVLGEIIWGIPGVFLAIPLIAMFKIVCDHIEPLKPYGYLIGDIETGKRKPGFIVKLNNWVLKKWHNNPV
jgi:predicted PurR-regulated permease PerM